MGATSRLDIYSLTLGPSEFFLLLPATNKIPESSPKIPPGSWSEGT